MHYLFLNLHKNEVLLTFHLVTDGVGGLAVGETDVVGTRSGLGYTVGHLHRHAGRGSCPIAVALHPGRQS